MKAGVIGFAVSILFATPLAVAQSSPGPSVIAPITPIKPPVDRPYPGQIHLDVDASDVSRNVIHVRESLSGVGPNTVLLYPQWLPGTHAPEGTIDRLAGLQITAGGRKVSWTRDPADVWAFRIHPPSGTRQVEIDFTYLAPTSPKVGAMETSPELLMIEWNELVLYPAGYYTRRIPASVSLTLPAGWQFATALETASTTGVQSTFETVPLETLVDSPLYAGRYTARLDLDPGASIPVHLDLFADRAQFLEVKPEQLAAYRSLVQQAYKLFGSHHYAHYDFLYSLSDQIQQSGLEHHQSSENGTDPDAFTSWDKTSYDRDLLPHEYTHSWNGKFRRPADLWTPNYNVPMQDGLLWVYEGQTQYWGQVLAARSGLRTHQEALDEIALTAAYYDVLPGRQWRSVQDTTSDEIINPRRPQSWTDWQRFEDYYEEGELIWLEADTLIRQRSNGKRSLDDFAKAFFGIDNGSYTIVTYTFDDIVKALNAIEPYDWASFLRERLDSVGRPAPLEGLRRGGYRLIYTDKPSDFEKARDEQRKRVSLLYSIGLVLDDKDTKGQIREVLWNGPAFKAKLTEGGQILSVNGVAYEEDVLKDAIRLAQTGSAPIELIVKTGDRYSVAHVDYHGGLRYPHLERDPSSPARLDDILAAKP
jgi:predicted metalloprotease with PDZ domain